MTVRPVQLVRSSRQTLEGAGVHLRRAFGNGDEILFDPFLMLDDFRGDDPAIYRRRLPLAPAPRHRDHHLHDRGRGATTATPG